MYIAYDEKNTNKKVFNNLRSFSLKNMDYKPSFLFRNGYINTVYPTYYRDVEGIEYKREKIITKDDDFLLLDWSFSKHKQHSSWLAIISHGLEGNSKRAYVKGMVRAFNSIGVDALAWNFRGCGGEINLKPEMYHSCKTDDLEDVLQYAINKGYKHIVLIGFSMGGNLSLYYAGVKKDSILPEIKGIIAFSVPVDLKDASETLAKHVNKIFMKRFLNMLEEKVKKKSVMFPDTVSYEGYDNIKNFKEFDDRYTAPLHGFKDANHYWKICSCAQYLEDIRITSLLVNAKDDPFLGKKCYPNNIKNQYLTVEFPKYGGHAGFVLNRKDGFYWSELRAIEFFKKDIIPKF